MTRPLISRGGRRRALALSFGFLLALLPAMVVAQDGDEIGRAIRAQERITAQLMTTPGVVGTGVGLNAAGHPAIRVYTVTPEVAIPGSADGVGIQRVVTGLIAARACQDTGNPAERCNRPVPIGVSVGHPAVTAGTIGARVTNGSSVFALSNNHVLANSNNATVGDSALQPGTYDGGQDPADRIGTLAAWKPISFNYSACSGVASDPDCNTIDAAIALTTTANLGVATLPGGYGTPSASTVAPSIGQSVTKCGRTTGCTTGTVAEVNVTLDVCYKPRGLFSCARDGVARFVNQIGVSDGTFSAGGDSGSLIVTTAGKNPVGLLFAGGSSRTYANEIGRVLGNFSVTIDTGGTPPPPDTIPPAAPTGLTATGGDGQVILDWANNSEPDLAGYNVYRGTTNGGPYSKVNSSLVTTSAYTDTGLANGTPYFYVVTAVDLSTNQSANSNEASATPQAAPPADGPTNLTASAFRQGTVKVDLTWTGGASSIDVYRQNPGASFTLIATTSNSGSYRDNLGKKAVSGTTYTYRVCSAGTTLCSGDAPVSVP